uniref:Tyrosine-protein phosphatase domain-containing protein n=1 Tax=Romanomermis culicivorax TaxID=13658 RepID=A0A915JNT6_ROMCU
MLTALNERGRSKCHQYWPEINTSVNFNNLIVKSTLEKSTDFGYCREFTVSDQKTQEERCVSQLQYSLWPDHGLPEDSNQFLEFMMNVRRSRAGTVDPL